MSELSIDELKTLVQQPKRLFVSIYMPIYRAGVDVQQNSTRLKTLKRQAEDSIVESGMSEGEALKFLQPLQELVDAEDIFWQENNGFEQLTTT